jgi:hypothetical protein
MGKASSSKKVARAARAGGATKGRGRQWLFPLSIVLIFVVGISIVVVARSADKDAAAATPAVGDHYHNAFGVFVCDKYLPALADSTAPDTDGIHTHGEGIIHIHPFLAGVAGKHATLSVYAERVQLKLSDNGVTMPDGTEYKKGYDCNGTPAEVSAYVWSDAFDDSTPPQIYTSNFGSIPLRTDRAAIALVIAPPGTDVPKPDSVPELNKLSDVDQTTNTSVLSVTPSTAATTDSSVVTPTSASTGQ